jgi:copper/silver efflux system protein
MIARVVGWCTRHPVAVLFSTFTVALGSYASQRSLPRDVIPDLSDPQIVLFAEWMGHSAMDVSTKVAQVLTAGLRDVPGATAVRGSSMSGMAYLDVIFASSADLAKGRDEIAARVEKMRAQLPSTARVQVGPLASSTGWVFQYALLPPTGSAGMGMGKPSRDAPPPLYRIRKFQDEILRPALSAIPGVAEVASVGGESQELAIETSPDQLFSASVPFSDVVTAATMAINGSANPTIRQLEESPLPVLSATNAAAPLRLKDVSRVRVAPGMSTGMADVDGLLPIVAGIVIAHRDANVPEVLKQVRKVMERERSKLPPGASYGVLYDRTELAGRIEHTLMRAVAEEIGVVVLIVLLFLLHFRSGLVPMITLPVVMLLTFAAMRIFGVPATVMSLGGIAIALGMAVDADLVALEACHRRLEAAGNLSKADRRSAIIAAAGAFAPAILTSLVIAALAFLPVFAFVGETGRLLRPLALTKTFVIVAAAVVTLTLAPALRERLLRGRMVPEMSNPITRNLVRIYRPFVHFALSWPVFTLVTAGLLAVSCLPILPHIGREFLPRVDEGDLFYMPTGAPGISPEDAVAELTRQDAAIAARPEVALVFGKIGRSDTATDPAPFSMAETNIRLKPRSKWPQVARQRWYSSWAPRPAKRVLRWLWPEETPATTAELIDALDHSTRFPGWTNAWTAPVRARIDMMSTGVRTPAGVRIIADDPARLDELGAAVRAAVLRISGTTSAVYESLGGETRPIFEPDAEALARHHVDPALVRSTADLVLSGGQIGDTLQPEEGKAPLTRPLKVRLSFSSPWPPRPIEDLIREATVRGGPAADQPVPLGFLGRLRYVTVPAAVRAERGEMAGFVFVSLSDATDVGSYVERARVEVDKALQTGETRLRPGERIEWTGQYELLMSGQRRLKIIAPIVILSMLVLLLIQFRSLTEALIVLVSVPFALVGSFWTLFLLGYRFSAPVWVGLLSVVGLAMQTGVVMVVYIDDAFFRRLRQGRIRGRDDIVEAHGEGTVRRLRPKLMTITTMAAALSPLLWSDGAGAEIMKRVAAPMIGGLATSAFLTLEVIPVLYTIWRYRQLRYAQKSGKSLEDVVGPAPTWAREPEEPPAGAEVKVPSSEAEAAG